MIYEEVTNEIRAVCEKLLKDGEVELIIAYTGGDVNGIQIPYFAREASDAANIEWGDRCWQTLAPYLHGLGKKAGILAKPCDARAIAQYLAEHQIKREDVYIIGVDCPGMVDEEGNPRPGCGDCTVRKPPLCDAYIKDARVDALVPPVVEAAEATAAEGGLAENFAKFKNEIDKCILCFACRQGCYGCYCKVCFIDRDLPDWQPAGIDAGTKMTFHMGRAMHLAGRCVECGSCEANCQSGVDVRYIIKEVTKFIEGEYGYSAGMDPEGLSALLETSMDDREIGFLGGGGHE